MKRCPKCGISYQDAAARCSECNGFLITDIMSDFHRSETHVTAADDVGEDFSEEDRRSSRFSDLILTPSTQYSANREQPHVMSGLHRLLRTLYLYKKTILFSLLFVSAVIILIFNWNIVQAFLSRILIGSVIGAVSFSFFNRRHISGGVISSGAVIGAIVSLLLFYKGAEIGAIAASLIPSAIIVYIIINMLSSIWK